MLYIAGMVNTGAAVVNKAANTHQAQNPSKTPDLAAETVVRAEETICITGEKPLLINFAEKDFDSQYQKLSALRDAIVTRALSDGINVKIEVQTSSLLQSIKVAPLIDDIQQAIKNNNSFIKHENTPQEFDFSSKDFDSQYDELSALRDAIVDGDLSDSVRAQIKVKTDSVVQSIQVAPLVYDIHQALSNSQQNFIQYTETPKEITVGQVDAATGFEDLETILHYLKNSDTPTGLKENFRIRLESPELMKEAASIIYDINQELKRYPHSKLTLKTPSGTTKEERAKVAEIYKQHERFARSEYSVDFKDIAKDIINISALLEKIQLENKKRIKIKLPASYNIAPDDVELLRLNIDHFNDISPGTFELIIPKKMLHCPRSPYRDRFVPKTQLIELGKFKLSDQQISYALGQLQNLKSELLSRGEGRSTDISQWALIVKSGAKIPNVLLKKIDEIRKLDFELQDRNSSFKENFFLFENRRVTSLPSKRFIELTEKTEDFAEMVKSKTTNGLKQAWASIKRITASSINTARRAIRLGRMRYRSIFKPKNVA